MPGKLHRYLLGGVTAAIVVWWLAGRPYSVAEAQFLYRLGRASDRAELDLGNLMPGDWELACDAHGYGGDFYVRKYARNYPAAGQMQDGAWGIVFISPDGSFQSAASTCAKGTYLDLRGCVARAQSGLVKDKETQGCAYFRRKDG
jgi:hypothetical protein